ncbi:hypothetical protein [Falsirhodobacter sp. 1013]|uniref:hypothetical protein n=1 Tax=Falsirhodobacter sp. 1013 TaxID=3417566 RepID=UPI003EBAFB78
MFPTPKEKKEGEPWFTLRDYLFGYNMGAATLQIIMAGAAVVVVYSVINLLLSM